MPEEKTFGGDFEPIARRQLPLFFMIDTSGSMDGSKIGTVNTTMRELLPELAGAGEADAEVKIAVLTFSSGCSWMTPAPMAPEKIVWNDLEANGLTDLGTACIELSKKMSRNEFLSSLGSTFAPIVILLSDGDPTDNYKSGLETLWKNKWFKNAMRLALPIGKDINIDVLAEFTGHKEAVLKPITNAAELKKMLKTVSITSTSFASRSSINPDEESGPVSKFDALLEEVHRAEEEPATPEYFPGGDDGGVDPNSIGYDDEDW